MNNELPIIKSGKILIYRLYDVAYEIDLLKVEDKLKREAKRLRIERKPFSKAFEFANPPVLFQLKGIEKEITGKGFNINVYSKAYDYGVISIILEIPVMDIDLLSFERLALSLEDNEDIDKACRDQLNYVVSILKDSLSGFDISRFEEDYTIFFIESFNQEISVDEFLNSYDVSNLMFYEEKPLGRRIKDELMSWRFSYYKNDGVILNWDNAFIIEPSGSMEIPDILEFANAQLLELRYYDHIVSRELDRIYEGISAKGALSIWKIGKYERLAAEVMKTVTELTDITEKIDSSLKVTEDVYYAKIYMAALKLFRVKEWEGGIKKKLDIASNVYDMLYREIANKRTELLELAIVILIMLEIVIFFFGK
ncbi:MAG: hypothetical protein M0Z70_14710 [Nitrospiraceae bacterium]|nr:hypothetical protein [Nitrospirota bacterium]MDA8340546.1 hypothetical protein [Nitrospiraceae bacterium]